MTTGTGRLTLHLYIKPVQLQSTIAHSSAMMASMSSLLSSRRAFRRDSTDHPWQDIAYNVVVNEVLDLIAEDSSEDEEKISVLNNVSSKQARHQFGPETVAKSSFCSLVEYFSSIKQLKKFITKQKLQTQIQKTIQYSLENLVNKINPTYKNGDPTGEEIFL